jgi:hypothetical protein
MKTCLDCKVLPPFSIALCPLHAAAEDMAQLLEALVPLLARVAQDEPIEAAELEVAVAAAQALVGRAAQ